jgi:hypothetical protein
MPPRTIRRMSDEQAITADLPGQMAIKSEADVDRYLALIQASARRAQQWLSSQDIDPLELFRLMKFGPVGFHPIHDRELNLVEQINQTWSHIAALAAARLLLSMHPEAGGFRLAPGAHAALKLDIMSERPAWVGAEVFAAVTPSNNGKLKRDLEKLGSRPEEHRYVFFLSPRFPTSKRQTQFDPVVDDKRKPIQVWSVSYGSVS